MIDLDELERLAKAATSGPWEVVDARVFLDDEDLEIRNGQHCIGFGSGEANAAYIVAACNAVPELIARVRELERQREALAFLLAQFLPHAECPLFDDCSLSHKKNVDVRDCAKQLIQGGLGHE